MREKIKNLEEFRVLQEKYIKARSLEKRKVLVCCGTGCTAGGNLAVYEELKKQMAAHGAAYELSLTEGCGTEATGIKKSGCHGFCEMGPLVRIEPEGWLYTKVHAGDVEEIVEKTLLGGEFIERLGYHQNGQLYKRQEDIPFYKKQTRRVLEHCGHIDAESIEEYFSIGGYTALTKALFEMSGDEVIAEVTDSGLRGRGGAGFPTGKKWAQVAAHTEEPIKYIVCNGDEGDPGAFMDRSCMEGDPHKILEGMIIAGVATGSTEGYIYVRAEYPLAVSRLSIAIAQAEEYGIIGDDILGSGKSFHMHINKGAGAFVCGEGSAMTASIEGNRGMPRTKPPRSVDKGLFGRPTCLNNVETFANVPDIIKKGAAWFRSVGTEGSPGTKAFALTHRPYRGPDGHHAARGRLRHRRRHQERQEVQGRPDRRSVRRLPHGGAPGSADGLRFAQEGRRDHRLRRSGRHGRGQLHGQHRAVLHELHLRGILRQVHALPRGHDPHERDPQAHHPGQGQNERHRRAEEPRQDDPDLLALRSGQDGAEPRPLHAAEL